MRLVLNTEEESIICNVDPLHMQMVFENIINNANKYSPEGSTVTIEIASTPADMTVRVSDQGIGIHKKDIPKLFKKFSRAENVISTASGTGLGLYWAKKLVELHKGEIKVSSKPGKGSSFSVIIPKEG